MFIRAYVEWIKLAPSWFVTKVQGDQATAILTACPQLRSQGTQWALPWLQTRQLYAEISQEENLGWKIKKNQCFGSSWKTENLLPQGHLWGKHFHFTPVLLERFSVSFTFYGAASGAMLPQATAAPGQQSRVTVGTHGQVPLCPGHCQGQAGSSTPSTNSWEQGRVSAALQQLRLF